MSTAPSALQAEATIGILGGGQLGRMLALAAARLGFKCHIFSPSPDSPAFDVVHRVTCADYTDTEALDRFAADVDVVTYEFENVPAETATFLAARVPVLPDPKILATTQDRLAEKQFVASLGIGTAPFADVGEAAALTPALERIGRPAVLKTRRFGYDGKGQAAIKNGSDPRSDMARGRRPALHSRSLRAVRARSLRRRRARAGRRGRMLRRDRERASRSHIKSVARSGRGLGGRRTGGAPDRRNHRSEFGYVGVLAVEMFVLRDGGILVNEIAPRVHNSGHWTLDGASISQFEQHIRAVAGWALAKPVRHGRVEMINLIGAEVEDYKKWLAVPGAAVHLYGKAAVRPGRKMGHVTRVLRVDRPRGAFRPCGLSCLILLNAAPRWFGRCAQPYPSHHTNRLQKEHACRFSSVTTMSTRPSRR